MQTKEPFQSFIEKEYESACRAPSDIHEHLPALRALAQSVQSVAEFGVRTGVSTRAFLAAGVRLRSYDLELAPDVQNLFSQASAAGKDAVYLQGDTLRLDIEPTDLLFIDTLHSGAQLSAELARHAPRVGRYIVFHDTITFALRDETASWTASVMQAGDGTFLDSLSRFLHRYFPKIHSFLRAGRIAMREFHRQRAPDGHGQGILNAVLRFLADHPDEWRMHAHYTNNNGLTVISRTAPNA